MGDILVLHEGQSVNSLSTNSEQVGFCERVRVLSSLLDVLLQVLLTPLSYYHIKGLFFLLQPEGTDQLQYIRVSESKHSSALPLQSRIVCALRPRQDFDSCYYVVVHAAVHRHMLSAVFELLDGYREGTKLWDDAFATHFYFLLFLSIDTWAAYEQLGEFCSKEMRL
jgi:hypothetical protein